jgi:hypothetical protein
MPLPEVRKETTGRKMKGQKNGEKTHSYPIDVNDLNSS